PSPRRTSPRSRAASSSAGRSRPATARFASATRTGRSSASHSTATGVSRRTRCWSTPGPRRLRVPDREPSTIAGVDGLRAGDGPIFAVIGVFDGLHLGHRYLLRHLVLEAERRNARPTVITFDSHPDEVIVGAAPPLLLDPADRLRLLGEAGVDVVVVQHFDAALRETEYDEFIHRITSRTRLAGLLMTPDAAFGHDRRGTAEAVAELGRRDGFDVGRVAPFGIGGGSL